MTDAQEETLRQRWWVAQFPAPAHAVGDAVVDHLNIVNRSIREPRDVRGRSSGDRDDPVRLHDERLLCAAKGRADAADGLGHELRHHVVHGNDQFRRPDAIQQCLVIKRCMNNVRLAATKGGSGGASVYQARQCATSRDQPAAEKPAYGESRRLRQVSVASQPKGQLHIDIRNSRQPFHQFGEIPRDAALDLNGEYLVVKEDLQHI